MQGGGEKKHGGTSSGGAPEATNRVTIADVPSGPIDEVVVVNHASRSSVALPDARVMEWQHSASRRTIPHRFRPPAPRRCDLSKRQSTNREVEEETPRSAPVEEPTNDSTAHASYARYGGRHCHSHPAPTEPPREPTIDELFSGEINPDAAYRGDWWRGGLYY